MKVFDIAYYYQGEYGIANVKFATIFAPDLNEAKARWLQTDSKALIINELSKEITRASK